MLRKRRTSPLEKVGETSSPQDFKKKPKWKNKLRHVRKNRKKKRKNIGESSSDPWGKNRKRIRNKARQGKKGVPEQKYGPHVLNNEVHKRQQPARTFSV